MLTLRSLVVLLAVAAASPAAAQLNLWQGPAAGGWDDPANWSADAVPGPGHYVLITPDGGAAVAGSALPASVELLGLNALVSDLATLTLDADLAIASKLLIGPAGVLDLGGASVTAADTIIGGQLRLGDGALLDSTAGILNAGTIAVAADANVHFAGGPLQNVGTLRTDDSQLQNTVRIDGDLFNAGALELFSTELEIGGRFINFAEILDDFDLSLSLVRTPDLCANLGTIRDFYSSFVCGVFYNAGVFGTANSGGVTAATLVNDGTFNTGDFGNVVGSVRNRRSFAGNVQGDVENEFGAVLRPVHVTGRIHSAGTVAVQEDDLAVVVNVLELETTAGFFAFVDALTVEGDFLNSMADPALFVATELGNLRFAGAAGTHRLRHPGADLGAVAAGYTDNFSIPRITLASGESLVLEDGNETPGVGIYAGALVLSDGVGQIASITGNGANLYYRPARPENAYLGGQTYPLAGGGAIAPVP